MEAIKDNVQHQRALFLTHFTSGYYAKQYRAANLSTSLGADNTRQVSQFGPNSQSIIKYFEMYAESTCEGFPGHWCFLQVTYLDQ